MIRKHSLSFFYFIKYLREVDTIKKIFDNFLMIVFILYLIISFSCALAGYMIGIYINKIVPCTVYGFFVGISVSLIFHHILLIIKKKNNL